MEDVKAVRPEAYYMVPNSHHVAAYDWRNHTGGRHNTGLVMRLCAL